MNDPASPTTLNAKLVVPDADEAIAWYGTVFGAVATQRFTAGDVVVFARLDLFGTFVTIKDEDRSDRSPVQLGAPGVLFEITTPDPDSLAAAAIDQGAEIVFPVQDQPYGARAGRIRDPFGHQWLISTPVTLDDEDAQAALDDMAEQG